MPQAATTRSIQAPPEQVFDVVAHIDNFRKVNPDIVAVEFVSESRQGVGTKFRETRRMGKREATTTLEVTEYEPPERVRIVSDEGGTIWDTVFTVEPQGDGSKLTLEMDARPYRLWSRIVTPIAMRMVSKAVESDMDALKAHCERAADA